MSDPEEKNNPTDATENPNRWRNPPSIVLALLADQSPLRRIKIVNPPDKVKTRCPRPNLDSSLRPDRVRNEAPDTTSEPDPFERYLDRIGGGFNPGFALLKLITGKKSIADTANESGSFTESVSKHDQEEGHER